MSDSGNTYKNGADNVVDIADLKKRRKKKQEAAKPAPKKSATPPRFGVWTYVQFIVLLGLVALLMSRCQG